jgi:mono/diheme cytochrome c family protein
MKQIVLILAGIALVTGLANAQQAATPAGNVARGKTLYEQTGCYGCHGRAGQGAQATGPRLSRTLLPLDAFIVVLRHPPKSMPPYEAVVLPDQDVADIYAYVQQLPAPRDPKTIPLLKP